MPSLSWENFKNLPGDSSKNFENLCRAMIRQHFGGSGEFKALKNQPGVEFHLNLTKTVQSLGDSSRWYGWQCKYHERTNCGDLRAASRVNIEHSIRMTEKHLSCITDWVLWTPYTLSQKDQNWLFELTEKFRVHHWSDHEVDVYLDGPGLYLRSTYFGELIATPDELKQRRNEAIQPIKGRLMAPVHQSTQAERTLRRMLGEPSSWDHLVEIGERLIGSAESITKYVDVATGPLRKNVERMIEVTCTFAPFLIQFHDVIAKGDLESIMQKLASRHTLIDDEVLTTPRRLRSLRTPIAIIATNILHDLRLAQSLLYEVEDLLSVGIVAVIADAGAGKTQLAAEISSSQENRSAGVLFLGQNLHRGGDINSIAQQLTLNSKSIEGIEQLLASLDAAAKRAGCRLPLVIDGLNEAENPKDWKSPLASISETIKKYPNVLMICTLRTGEHARSSRNSGRASSASTNARESFAVMSLPENIRKIQLEGFGSDTYSAVQKYFDYFKIDSGSAEVPMNIFNHPLTLRMYCQVTNPDREKMVVVESFPTFPAPIFDKFIWSSAQRISELPKLSYSYQPSEVYSAIVKFGIMLWESNAREVGEKEFCQSISSTNRQWESNLVNLLSQEGLIFRNPGKSEHEFVITPVYDMLGGFIIANALLSEFKSDDSFGWLNNPVIEEKLGGKNSHELASDIFSALVYLTPAKANGTQLWQVVAKNFKLAALIGSIRLEAKYLNSDTVDAVTKLFIAKPQYRKVILDRLYFTKAISDHPFNCNFLDEILCNLANEERDLHWTEWVRETRDKRIEDLRTIEERWKSIESNRKDSDRLRARWIKWFLSSTDRELRDVATRTLFWYGRGASSELFAETLLSLKISDPYIPERMFAASYGVAMALHAEAESFVLETLSKFSKDVYNTLFSDEAQYKTTHLLLRTYAQQIIEISVFYNSNLFSKEQLQRTMRPISSGKYQQWSKFDKANVGEGPMQTRGPFRMDFENYTLGRLVTDRRNYDYDHEEYREIRSKIRWRIDQLGWSSEKFEEIDSQIEQRYGYPRLDDDARKTERYGKKYSWIAYYEMAGLLRDLGKLDDSMDLGRTSEVDIDPSFPKCVELERIIQTDFLGDAKIETTDWIKSGDKVNISPYFSQNEVKRLAGPWIMLDGFFCQEDEDRGRRMFSFIRSFIVRKCDAEKLLTHLSNQSLGGRRLPEKPSVYYTFSGEIPWSSAYPKNGIQQLYLNNFRNEKDWKNKTTFDVTIPVCDFCWESYHSITNDSGSAITLAKEIAIDLNLFCHAQEFDLYDLGGAKATLCVSDHSGDYKNTQTFFYLREDLLQIYLEKNSSSLIWAVWGEKGYSSNLQLLLAETNERPSQFYSEFQDVMPYIE